MTPLKALSKDAIPTALSKADRYRLLNEPLLAESICLDILAVEPDNQEALVTMLLALTDQFGKNARLGENDPKDIIRRMHGEYERAYYTGIVEERKARALLDEPGPKSGFMAFDYLSSAMHHYEQAAELRPVGNDDALLRWNTCARLMKSHGVNARTEDPRESFIE